VRSLRGRAPFADQVGPGERMQEIGMHSGS
jgi:hypothetical protein